MMTGPYLRTGTRSDFYFRRQWYRTKPPFTASRPPCPYELQTCTVTDRNGYYSGFVDAAGASSGYYSTSFSLGGKDRARSLHKAYAKFVDKVNLNAMAAVNWQERSKSLKMIEKRANTLIAAFFLLQKGRRRAAKRALGMNSDGPRWSRPRDASNIWLEWHFGWAPLIEDIHNSIKILESEWTPKRVFGAASTRTTTGTGNFGYMNLSGATVSSRVLVRIQADVSVSNPMLHKATQLGLVNPASVAWELIPFSFLVDWFLPVGAFLASYTDFAGLKLADPFTTTYVTSHSIDFTAEAPPSTRKGQVISDGAALSRVLGIEVPLPRWLPPKRLSAARAATAIALIVQLFSPKL